MFSLFSKHRLNPAPAVEGLAGAAFRAHQSFVLCLIGVTAVAFTAVVFPGAIKDMLVNLTTGVIAMLCLAICLVRLAVTVGSGVRRVWAAICVLLAIVAGHELMESVGLPTAWGVEDVTGALLLVASVSAAWLLARMEPIPRAAGALFWAGFGLQAVAIGLDSLDTLLVSRFAFDSAVLEVMIDFTQLIAIQVYFGALAYYALAVALVDLNAGAGIALGDLARFIFVYGGHYQILRYPDFNRLKLPLAKQGLTVAHFVYWLPQLAGIVSVKYGRSIPRQIVDMAVLSLRHGLDAQAYYLFELYRPEQWSKAGAYLARFEMKNGLINSLNRLFPKRRPNSRSKLADKLQFAELCAANGISHIPILGLLSQGVIRKPDRPSEVSTAVWDEVFRQDFFVKPMKSRGARGAGRYRRLGENSFQGPGGEAYDRSQLMHHLIERSETAPLLLQPRLRNHPALQDLAEQSLMAIRVFTCMEVGGALHVTHAMLRVLGVLEPNWATRVELAAKVDLESGALGLITGDKGPLACTWLERHPFTGTQVQGRLVPSWDKIKAEAMKAHRACGDRFIVGWDIACTPEGPVIIEGNSYPDVEFLQRVHRQPIGESPLGPLMVSHLMRLQHTRDLMRAAGFALGKA